MTDTRALSRCPSHSTILDIFSALVSRVVTYSEHKKLPSAAICQFLSIAHNRRCRKTGALLLTRLVAMDRRAREQWVASTLFWVLDDGGSVASSAAVAD